MPDYDWGERQERVNGLITKLESIDPNYSYFIAGQVLTCTKLIEHIKKGTDIGKEVVAVSGLVFQAFNENLVSLKTNIN